jgi:hypothetical protein
MNIGAKMLQHSKSLLENPYNLIAISPKFNKLVTALRTTVANEYKLDKEQSSYHDILSRTNSTMRRYNIGG